MISSYLARVRYKMNKMCSRNARGFQLDQTDPHCNSSSLFTAVRRRGLEGPAVPIPMVWGWEQGEKLRKLCCEVSF